MSYQRWATTAAAIMLTLGLAYAAMLMGCNARPRATQPVAVLEADRFPHPRHATLACAGCHPTEIAPNQGHSPCDQNQCHQAAFTQVPEPRGNGRLCLVCHSEITLQPLRAPLRVRPAPNTVRALPATFSHRQHLDAAGMDQRVGFHLNCSDCHTFEKGQSSAAGHAACARCHAADVRLTKVATMTDCTGCHRTLDQTQRSPAELIRGDLRFGHADHKRDRAGANIACGTCHLAAGTAGAWPAPAIATCVVCHDDSARVSELHRVSQCQTCHLTKQSSLLALAPRNHLPASEQPTDHTLAFRTDHAVAANDAARCARCHREVSGSPGVRTACAECHFVMRPRDHRLTWREFDHGADASASPDRCALCHVPNYCTSCHQQRPRSHIGGFETMHGATARINVRACLTCHDPIQSCQGSGCHETIR
ncbi:MAG: hypothetical protein KBG15_01150 [Kofleriaceae bacterium]|nr:hypothetical protein [Kofleriaceae bacterium]